MGGKSTSLVKKKKEKCKLKFTEIAFFSYLIGKHQKIDSALYGEGGTFLNWRGDHLMRCIKTNRHKILTQQFHFQEFVYRDSCWYVKWNIFKLIHYSTVNSGKILAITLVCITRGLTEYTLVPPYNELLYNLKEKWATFLYTEMEISSM